MYNKDHFCPNFILRPDPYAKMVPKFFFKISGSGGVLIPSHLVSRPGSYWQEFTVCSCMDYGLNKIFTKKIKFLRPGSYWKKFTVIIHSLIQKLRYFLGVERGGGWESF